MVSSSVAARCPLARGSARDSAVRPDPAHIGSLHERRPTDLALVSLEPGRVHLPLEREVLAMEAISSARGSWSWWKRLVTQASCSPPTRTSLSDAVLTALDSRKMLRGRRESNCDLEGLVGTLGGRAGRRGNRT